MPTEQDDTIVIVHLSDLHLSGNHTTDYKIVINALLEDLKTQLSTVSCDLIVFSGDLVHSGAVPEQFTQAKAEFIDTLLSATKIPPPLFVICPGNHDIDRNVIRNEPWVETGLFQHLKTRTSINEFLPTIVAMMAYNNIGSEKLVELFDLMAGDETSDILMKLLCGFILLELDTDKGFKRLEALTTGEGAQWIINVVTQRLYYYYRTRPLSDQDRTRFEQLVAELEIKLHGKGPSVKSRLLQEIRKHAFQEK